MNRNILLAGGAVIALISSAVPAAEKTDTKAGASETNEQKCERWADHGKLQGAAKAEYIKDCLIDLRVPEKQEGGGGDD